MQTELQTRITRVERVGTTPSGNPFYRVEITDPPRQLLTKRDAACNYGITNSNVVEGQVILELEDGVIVHVKSVEKGLYFC